MAIHIVTDSTCDLPDQFLTKYNIHVVPLNVHFDNQVYQDKFEISPDEFYKKLVAVDEPHPTTSQPSPAEFVKKYKQLSKSGDTIISLHLSQKFSGTYQSALLAKDMIEENVKIKVVDSKITSLAMGQLIIKIARGVEAGKIDYTNIENVVDKY